MFSQITRITSNTISSTFRRILIPQTHFSQTGVMNFSTQALKVQHEPSRERFVINYEGFEAQILYKKSGETIHFLHTDVPKEMEGKGVGKVLAKVLLFYLSKREAIQFAKAQNLKTEVSCHFIQHYINKYEPSFKFISKIEN